MKRVLVVDDDRGAVQALCKLLALDGFAPRGARSGEEALALLGSEPFEAVVTDLEMPRVSGLRVVAAAPRAGLVVVVTAFLDSPACAQALTLGARRVLGKPLAYEQLAMELAAL